ncbi:hypothetical protein ACFVT1_09585 [Streptomyces sp. NPDC057963]|uniref:hypothetical protein n=1 Tax=Streptomyces sp. NPDC057963 TaxID=3346290 RepID=UPI0036E0F450
MALDLTGGPDGQQDDPDTFKQRLVAEQHRLHTEGDGGGNWGGMGSEGQERINEAAVGSATGSDYERQDLDSAADRRAVLTEVEKSRSRWRRGGRCRSTSRAAIGTEGMGQFGLGVIGHQKGRQRASVSPEAPGDS